MCGIIGAVANKNVLPILLDGLKKLEYRGYDSSGIAVINHKKEIDCIRSVGKINKLEISLQKIKIEGMTGIAHTRWATHGLPTKPNAHPHVIGNKLAIVCNGIIENYELLKSKQKANGFVFQSETDTEVILNEVYQFILDGKNLLEAVQETLKVLEGSYTIGMVCTDEPNRLVGTKQGFNPLIIGIGCNEAYIASDILSLLSVSKEFYILEDGDVVDIQNGQIRIFDEHGYIQNREKKISHLTSEVVELGEYRHFMLKEIHEQSIAISNTLHERLNGNYLLESSFGESASYVFNQTKSIQIIACGTSYHAGLVSKYWFEELSIPCQVEIASEFRSRIHAVPEQCLIVTISQSGETIDTLSALTYAKNLGYNYSLTICNTEESSLARASDLTMITSAGPEIGVASTKAFTTQLTALRLLVLSMARRFDLSKSDEADFIVELKKLPDQVDQAMNLELQIQSIAEQSATTNHALFIGRGVHYPIALEGALKLKEISYIHAEAYPAGELKHGPMALIDHNMLVIAVAPNDHLLDKIKTNIEEIRVRGAKIIVFSEIHTGILPKKNVKIVNSFPIHSSISPTIFSIFLQLFAYHVALIKGTDIDTPRNLAKSVTVE